MIDIQVKEIPEGMTGKQWEKKKQNHDTSLDVNKLKKDNTITICGTKYRSMAAAARNFGLKPDTAIARLKSGWSIDDAFTKPLIVKSPKIVIGGNEYTMPDAAKHFSINEKTLYGRIRKGMSPDEAVKNPVRRSLGRASRPVTIYGKTYPSISAAASFFEIKEHTLRKRIDKGISPDNAICDQASAKYKINGHPFNKQAEIADFYEVPLSRFLEKFKEHNGDPELALQAVRDSMIKIENDYYTNLTAACRAYGISRNVFDRRIKKGMSYEDALLYDQRKYREEDRAANPRMVRESIQPIVRGMQFNSVTSLIKYFRFTTDNLSLSAIERLRNGGDPEQCIMAQVLILADRLKLIDPETLQYFDSNKIPEGSIFTMI